MIVAKTLLSLIVALPAASQTVWWNTQGGQVIELRDGTGASCILSLPGEAATLLVDWEPRRPATMMVQKSDWHFPKAFVQVAVKVGKAWLDDDRTPHIPAQADASSLIFALPQDIDSQLSTADQVVLNTDNDVVFAMALPKARLPGLIAGVNRCRDATRGN